VSRRAPRPKSFTSTLGWPAEIDAAGVVTIQDPSGRVRASYQGTPSRYPTAALPESGTHLIRLPEGDVELFNGNRPMTRRRDLNGHVVLHGRRYEFVHTWRWNTSLLCDGVRVLELHRRSSNRFSIRHQALRDDIDRLAAALCWYAVRPGRAGAFGEAMSSFSL
jgi:hypothetical protein